MKKHNMIFSVFLLLTVFTAAGFAQTERWVYRFDGQNHSHDFGRSITYGPDGYLYGVGSSKYNNWSDNFTVVSLDQNGAERWRYLYITPGSTSDNARSVTCGTDRNVYVAGHSHCVDAFYDLLVVSLDANGTERWKYRSDSTRYVWDDVNSIIYGLDSNLYVAGSCGDWGSFGDFTVLSLDANGNERWLYRLDGSANSIDWAESVIFGPDNRIYACGRTWDSTFYDDFTVVCLDQNGMEQWVYKYNNPGWYCDRAHALVFGIDGNIYIAGESDSPTQPLHESDFMVISLDADGNERWVYRYNGSGDRWDVAFDIVCDNNGAIYATGITWTGEQFEDVITICLDPLGTEKWIYTYNGIPPRNNDHVDRIQYGQDGNLYMAGCSDVWLFPDTSVCLAICIDTCGSEKWVYRYYESEFSQNMFRSLTCGAYDDVYFAGLSHDSLTETDFIVVGLSTYNMIEENKGNIKISHQYGPTILNGPLILPANKKCRVIDISGRVVEPKGVSPGIYFIEIEGVISHKIVKVK